MCDHPPGSMPLPQTYHIGDIVELSGVVVSVGECGATGVKLAGIGHEAIVVVPAATLARRRARPAARLVYSPPEGAGRPPA